MPPPRPATPPLTNIGTTVPPRVPLAVPAPRLVPPAPGVPTGIPVALPVAGREGEAPGPQAIAPDPLWVSRWQPSATPQGQPRPWVVGYRWWVQGVVYQSIRTPLPYFRIDLMWRDHRHAYIEIPRDLWERFRRLTTSVGQFFHREILGPGWRPGAGARYPGFPL